MKKLSLLAVLFLTGCSSHIVRPGQYAKEGCKTRARTHGDSVISAIFTLECAGGDIRQVEATCMDGILFTTDGEYECASTWNVDDDRVLNDGNAVLDKRAGIVRGEDLR